MPTPLPEHDSWVQSTFGINPADYTTGDTTPANGAGAAAPGGFLDSLGDAASSAVSGVANVATDVVQTVGAVGSDIGSGASRVAGDAAQAVGDAGSSVATGFEKAAGDVGTAIDTGDLSAIGRAVGDIGQGFGDAAGDLASGAVKARQDAAQAAGAAEADVISGARQVAADAGKAISGVIAGVEGAAVAAGEAAKKALGDSPGDKPAPKQPEHQVLGSAQTERAQKLIDKMSDDDRKKLDELLQGAKSNKERLYITKTIAAGHSVADAEAFEKKIAGKDEKWMQDNLSLTGDSQGKGVQQQWSHSCNATTVEAVRGELDPIYALKMHEDNPNMGKVDDSDATKDNPNLAADQKAKLTSTYHGDAAGDHSGVAADRDDGAHGSGRWANDLLNNMSDVTGVKYDTKKVGDGATTDDAMKTIDDNTATGTPVPLVIGNGEGQYTHYVLVTATDPGPPKQYSIHDPWTGTTVIRSEDQLKNGKLDIAGSNQITAFEKPTPVEVK